MKSIALHVYIYYKQAVIQLSAILLLMVMSILSTGLLPQLCASMDIDLVEMAEKGEKEQESEEKKTEKETDTDEYLHGQYQSVLIQSGNLLMVYSFLSNWSNICGDIHTPPPELS